MEVVIILAILIIIAVLIWLSVEMDFKKGEAEKQNNRKHKEKYGVPENASLLCCTNIVVNQIVLEENWSVFAWKDNNILNFCGTNDCNGVRKISISIENIQFYTRNGDYRVETTVEGGGVDLGGAVVGGVLAGGVGALLGGREKITTTNKEIDDRNTYLYYIENNENKRMVFTSKDYNELSKLIPEKEMSYIQNSKIVESNTSQGNNIYKDIEELAKLRDKDILTEEEFNQKKQLLLDKIQ